MKLKICPVFFITTSLNNVLSLNITVCPFISHIVTRSLSFAWSLSISVTMSLSFCAYICDLVSQIRFISQYCYISQCLFRRYHYFSLNTGVAIIALSSSAFLYDYISLSVSRNLWIADLTSVFTVTSCVCGLNKRV